MPLKVDAQHPAYQKVQAQRTRLRLTYSGTDAVKGAGTDVLPMLGLITDPGAQAQYQAYVKRAFFYGAVPRTVEGISGLVFRNPPQTTIPLRSQALDLLNDVTLTGLPLDRFAQSLYREVLTLGFGGVYVTIPQAPVGVPRAYMTLYKAEDVINWRLAWDSETFRLRRVVLKEVAYEEDEDDRFTLKEVTVYRELFLDDRGMFAVNLFKEGKVGEAKGFVPIGPTIEPRSRGQRLGYIPFVPCNPDSNEFVMDKMPLLPLADANLDHYRLMADYRHGLHWVGLPTPVVTGVESTDKLSVGPARAWGLPAGSTASMLEFTGQGLTPLKDAIEMVVQYMASLGAKLVQQEKRQTESAETHRIKQSREEATAVSVSESVSAALSQGVTMMLNLSGIPGEAAVELNRDLVDAKLKPEEIRELVSAWQAGAFTWETLHHNLDKGEVMRPDITADQEKQLLDAQAPRPAVLALPGDDDDEGGDLGE